MIPQTESFFYLGLIYATSGTSCNFAYFYPDCIVRRVIESDWDCEGNKVEYDFGGGRGVGRPGRFEGFATQRESAKSESEGMGTQQRQNPYARAAKGLSRNVNETTSNPSSSSKKTGTGGWGKSYE
jgi:hypothetical protein